MEVISALQAAKLLGISVDQVNILEKQGVLHAVREEGKENRYSTTEIAQIKTRRGLSVSEEAAQVATQIQREVFTAVSSLITSRKTYTIFGAVVCSFLVLLFFIIGVLFYFYPLQTSDFFGYYYRFNIPKQKISISSGKGKAVLAAEIGPGIDVNQTSIAADIIKPIAAASLIAVKVVDDQKYVQIVTNPSVQIGSSGQVGNSGSNGTNGINGIQGLPGLQGATGLSGINGTNGTNGTNGASVVISDFSNITNGTNTTASMVIGSGGSLSATGNGIIAANSFSGLLSVESGGTGVSTLTINGILFGNGTGNTQATSAPTSGQILLGNAGGIPTFMTVSGDATISNTGGLTLVDTGTAGTYGSPSAISVFTTDTQGRITSVTNTTIAGLTVANFGSANISQWINDAGYITPSSTNTLSNKTISASSNTISNLTNSNFSGSAGITNANLANSSVTLDTGNGLSGGGTLSLGSLMTLVNTGVLSLTGTNNQIAVSTASGTITLSLPQNVNTGASPTFAGLTLSNNSNQLAFGTTNIGILSWLPTAARTLILPDAADTLVGKATTDIFTNKTISAVSNTISGLTNTNFSGTAGITNANLANSSVTLSTSSPLSGGSSVSLGGSLTLSCPTCVNINETATMSAGTKFGVTDPDALLVAGTIVPTTFSVPINISAITTSSIFIADNTYKIAGVKCVASVPKNVTLQISIDTGIQAPGAGTNQLTSSIDLSGTANIVVSGTLIASPTTLHSGDRISAVISGNTTNIVGICTVGIKRM